MMFERIDSWERFCDYVSATADNSNIVLVAVEYENMKCIEDVDAVERKVNAVVFSRTSLSDDTPYVELQRKAVEELSKEYK